jgi:hypothetical protein
MKKVLMCLVAMIFVSSPVMANLVNGSFETDSVVIAPDVTVNFIPDVWGVEYGVDVVTSQNGVTPVDGINMLSMGSGGGTVSQAYQATNVSAFASSIDAGLATFNLGAVFNVSSSVTTAYGGVTLHFFDNPPVWNSPIATPLSDRKTFDNDPSGWELSSINDLVPVGTRWVVSEVTYKIDSLNGNYGYVDTAELTLTIVPEPATMALLGLGGLFLRKRNRRFR